MTPVHSSTSSSEAGDAPATPANDAPAKRWRFPIAAMAAIVLVTGFEAAVWKFRYRVWDANYVLLEKKRRAMTRSERPDTVAIFGMSRFYHVDPEPIKQLFGPDAKVTNYAWGWCGIEAYEAMLRGMIQAERAPKVILVDGIPEILGYKPELVSASRNEIFQVGLAQTAPRLALIRTQIGMKEWDWAWRAVARTLTPPSTLYRQKVTEGLWTLFREQQLIPLPVGLDRTEIPWESKGWFVFAPGSVATEEDFTALEKVTGPYKLYENDDALHSYRRFVKLADEHGIKVILLPVPNNPLMYGVYEQSGVFAAYDRYLDKLEEKYSNFEAPEPRWLNWPQSLADAMHVHEEGAARHMDLVLELLKKSGVGDN